MTAGILDSADTGAARPGNLQGGLLAELLVSSNYDLS